MQLPFQAQEYHLGHIALWAVMQLQIRRKKYVLMLLHGLLVLWIVMLMGIHKKGYSLVLLRSARWDQILTLLGHLINGQVVLPLREGFIPNPNIGTVKNSPLRSIGAPKYQPLTPRDSSWEW